MRKPVVFIDIDGTVADSFPWWLSLYNVENKTSWQMKHLTKYDVSWLGGIEKFYGNYEGVKVMDGALIGIKKLERHYRLIYVTVGYGGHWLYNALGVLPKDIIHIKDRSLLKGFALIDDNDMNLLDFQGDRRYLVKQPWSENSTKFVPQTWEEITEGLLHEASNTTGRVLSYPI